MATTAFKINGLLSMAVDGLFNVQRMGSALSQVANAGDNVAKAFQAQAYAAGFANIAATKFITSLGGVTNAAAQFEEAMAKARSIVSDTPETLDRIRTSAMTMRDSLQGPSALVDALTELHRAGIDGAQALNDVKVVSDVAIVAEMKLADAAVSVATAFKGWAGPLDTSAKIMDRFVAAANQSTFGLKGLMKAMEMAQRQAIPMGVSLETTLTGLMLLAPITGPNSKAGTAFGSFVDRMGDPRVLKNMATQFPNMKLSPYSSSGRMKDPLDYLAEIYEKRETLKNDQQKHALDKVLTGKIGKSMFAAMQRVFDMGIEVTDPITGAKDYKYGREGIAAAKASLTGKNRSLSEQAEIIRKNPRAAWQMFQNDMERAFITFGHQLILIFNDMKPVLTQVAKAFQFLSHAAGGALPVLFSLATTFALFRVVSGGLRSAASILPSFFMGRTMGPMNPGLPGAGGNAGTAAVATLASQRAAYAQAAAGPGGNWLSSWLANRHYTKNANSVGRGMFGKDYRFGADAARDATILPMMDQYNAMYNPQKGLGPWVSKYYGREGMRNAYAWGSSSKLGAIGGIGAAAGAGLMSGAIALGPMAALAAAAYGLTYAFSKLQDNVERQDKNTAKASGIITDLPSVHRMALKIAESGTASLSSGEVQMLTQHPLLAPILGRYLEAGAADAKGGGSMKRGIHGAHAQLIDALYQSAAGDSTMFEKLIPSAIMFGEDSPQGLFGSETNRQKMRESVARMQHGWLRRAAQESNTTGKSAFEGGIYNPALFSGWADMNKFGKNTSLITPDDKDAEGWLKQFGIAASGYGFGDKTALKRMSDLNANNPIYANTATQDTPLFTPLYKELMDKGKSDPLKKMTGEWISTFAGLKEMFAQQNSGGSPMEEAAKNLSSAAEMLSATAIMAATKRD